MYHVNLGNRSQCTGAGPYLTGKVWGPNVGVQNASFVDALTDETVSFLHLQDLKVGSLVRPRSSPIQFHVGVQIQRIQRLGKCDFQRHRAWVVRDGDVLAPCTESTLFAAVRIQRLCFSRKRQRAR